MVNIGLIIMNRKIALTSGTALILILATAVSLMASPASADKVSLNHRELSFFLRCALQKEDPSWMWSNDGDTIRVGESEFGLLLGGAQHIRYSALPTCITEYARLNYAEEEKDYFDGLSMISGLPLFQDRQGGQTYSNEINYYNPELIRWIELNMIPDPVDNFTLDTTFQKLYDIVARRNARILAFTLIELQKSGDFQKSYESYRQLDGQGRVDMKYEILRDSPLQDEYSAEVTDQYGYNFAPGHAATFWFRREMDGTADEVLSLLKAVFEKYDQDVLNRLK
tara:strand:- start:228 stop:1073 length:846 start_codon:yes stop_codon:yes gene_type:complete